MMKENNKNLFLSIVHTCLVSVAFVFALAPCLGRMYEPTVPEAMKDLLEK